jgi:hypothetical protein
MLNPAIFREYDIRGVADPELLIEQVIRTIHIHLISIASG